MVNLAALGLKRGHFRLVGKGDTRLGTLPLEAQGYMGLSHTKRYIFIALSSLHTYSQAKAPITGGGSQRF